MVCDNVSHTIVLESAEAAVGVAVLDSITLATIYPCGGGKLRIDCPGVFEENCVERCVVLLEVLGTRRSM